MNTYRTIGKNVLRVPGRRPMNPCHDKRDGHLCTRWKDHGGRHCAIRWPMGGVVRAVWGQKPDTSASIARFLAARAGVRP